MPLPQKILQQAANQARGLAIDAVHACNSGHLGLPLGAAEIGAVLFGDILRVNPANPGWLNRDRFVLSAGHGSMFLYAWLHLSGFDLSREDLRKFRQMGSCTPGHPEFGETPGVESTTGPLGQGVGNAVGMAMAAKMAAARFNTREHAIFDHTVFCLAGDGCLQEGVAAEAAAFAGHFGLDNLVLIYDANAVTLDAMASETQSEDTAQRFAAYGFDVAVIDGHDLEAVHQSLQAARDQRNGKPKLVICQTEIARGIPEVAGTAKGHGEGGAKFAEAARKGLGLPGETFFVSAGVEEFFEARKVALAQQAEAWEERFSAWQAAHPDLAAQLTAATTRQMPPAAELLDAIPAAPDKANATRNSGGEALNALAAKLPQLISGSADLHGSTKNYLAGLGDFTRDNPGGRNIRFGIREHAMGAIMNGVAYHGIFLASGATFATFADYMRPAVRLASLSHLPVFYLWTHDSVGVGEDGPTHQPVEIVASLRAIPNLDVIRPADAEETAGALVAAVTRTDGPTGLILTRQNVPNLATVPAGQRRRGAMAGGYIARRESTLLEGILLASGSELAVALAAAEELGSGVRVVSLPCFERFRRLPAAEREAILPAACRRRVAVEAGVRAPWYQWVGLDGAVVGIDRFGFSAPGDTVLQELGMTPANVAKVFRELSAGA